MKRFNYTVTGLKYQPRGWLERCLELKFLASKHVNWSSDLQHPHKPNEHACLPVILNQESKDEGSMELTGKPHYTY